MGRLHRNITGGGRASKRISTCLVVAFLLFGVLGAFPPRANAWKPVAHVHLAEVARLDAIDDGRVTIYEVDYEAGVIIGTLGTYAVDPDILKALRACPEQYRAGAIGADFVPDIAVAQLLVHPDNRSWGNTRSDAWLQRFWTVAGQSQLPASLYPSQCTDALAVKAYAVGMLTHAAGDMYGHSYINEFAGGSWEINSIAARHMLLESYVDKRTPDDSPGFYTVSIDGAEGAIYDVMLGPNNPSGAANLLGSDVRMEDFTFPRLFGGLRALLQGEISAYNSTVASYTAQWNAKIAAARACKLYDFSCSAAALYAEATDILWAKSQYVATHGPFIAYLKAWRDDIDDGLRAWPAASFAAHRNALFRQPETRYPSPDATLEPWVTDHLLSMMGLPDAVGQSISYDLVKALLPDQVEETFEAMQAGLYNWLVRSALGDQIEEWSQYINSPELYFDDVPGLLPNDGCWMSLEEMNQSELGLADAGFANPEETYDWQAFRPMYNSVVMAKLSLLGPQGVQELMADLGVGLNLSGTFRPLTLGYMNSLDESNQGIDPEIPSDGRMLLASYPSEYRHVFMRQRGVRLPDEPEGVECATRYHGEDTTIDEDETGGSSGDTGPGLSATTFRSNGDQIAGWYWLRDAGLNHYAEWEFEAVEMGSGDLELDITALATDRAGGGRGFDAVFRLLYGFPGAGRMGGVLQSTVVVLPNVADSDDPVGYTCNGTVVIPQTALHGGSSLFVRVERLSPTEQHVAFCQDSIVVRTGHR